MYTFSGTTTSLVTITHRGSDYGDADIALMQSEFAFLENVRTKGYQIPAAGGGTDLQLYIEFIGVAAASGIVGQIAYNVFNKIVKAMLNLYHHRTNEFPLIHFDDITLAYEDVTITIMHLEPESIEQLPAIMQEVSRLIGTLSEQPPHAIKFPFHFNGSEFVGWNKNADSSSPKTPLRYWLLKIHDASGPSDRIYDYQTKAIIDVSYPRLSQITRQGERMSVDETERFLEELLSNPDNLSS